MHNVCWVSAQKLVILMTKVERGE